MGITVSLVDVSSPEETSSFINAAYDKTGSVDILFKMLEWDLAISDDFPDGYFEHHVVFIYGTIYGMRYALPIMHKQGYGRIIILYREMLSLMLKALQHTQQRKDGLLLE